MKKKSVFRAVSVGVAAALSAGAMLMFAGCSSNHPEVTITYTFKGKDYAVDYVLSRTDAPNTVQHFIELADAGFYNGLVVHDYQDFRIFAGGYRLNDDGELELVDYFERVKELEEERGVPFTQSVWYDEACTQGTYTVYGEFSGNGVQQEYGKEYAHSTGALVMYYTAKDYYNGNVTVKRADGGDPQQVYYRYNCATSLFYTWTSSDTGLYGSQFCVFGMAKDYETQMENGLLAAIEEHIATLENADDFTEEIADIPDRYDPIEDVARSGYDVTYATPVDEPIVISSVRVTKY